MKLIKADWSFGLENIKEKLEKQKIHLTEKQYDVITPVALPSKNYDELRNAYMKSVQKLRRYYHIPAFSNVKMVYFNNMSWFVYSKAYLEEWLAFILREANIKLPDYIFEPHKLSDKVIDKELKFFIKPKEKAQFDLVKVFYENKAIGYNAINEILNFKEIR